MESIFSTSMNEINVIAKLADLKEGHYHHLLTLSTLIELLIEKGVLTREEIDKKAMELDQFMAHPPYPTV